MRTLTASLIACGSQPLVRLRPRDEAIEDVSKNSELTSAPQREASEHQALEPEPRGVGYDSELERLCRIAASVGWEQEAPVSYTALVIAFLFGEDKVSVWFDEDAG